MVGRDNRDPRARRHRRRAVRLRATLVFERRADRWQVVHVHASAPIDDAALAHEIGGDGATVNQGLVVDCAR